MNPIAINAVKGATAAAHPGESPNLKVLYARNPAKIEIAERIIAHANNPMNCHICACRGVNPVMFCRVSAPYIFFQFCDESSSTIAEDWLNAGALITIG